MAKPKKTRAKHAQETKSRLGKEIGERIARARSAVKLTTIASLHKRTIEIDPEHKGISQPVLLGYEDGSYRPGARELKLLSLAMGVSPTWLLFGQENQTKEVPSAAPVKLTFAEEVFTLTDEHKRGVLLGLLFGYMTPQERDAWIAVVELFLRAKLGDKQFEFSQFALKAITDLITGEAGLFTEIEKMTTEKLSPQQIEALAETFRSKATEIGLPIEEAKNQVHK